MPECLGEAEGKDTLSPRPRFLLQLNGCSSQRKALSPRPKFARHALPSPILHEPSYQPERGPPATCPPLHCRPGAHTYPHRAAPCQFCAKGPWLDRSLENLLFSSEEAGWGWLGSLQGPTSFLFLNALSLKVRLPLLWVLPVSSPFFSSRDTQICPGIEGCPQYLEPTLNLSLPQVRLQVGQVLKANPDNKSRVLLTAEPH